MIFWIICLILTCVVGLVVVTPLIRPPLAEAEDPQVALYKGQLAEVDRDVAREVIIPEEAERAKAEIARRLLAASGVQTVTSESPIGKSAAIAVGLSVLMLSGAIYWQLGAPGYPDMPLQTRIANGDEYRANRPTQAMAEVTAPTLEAPAFPQDYLDSVAQLRALVPLRETEVEGWELLAFHESQLRNYAAAAVAQGKVVELKGEEASLEDLTKHVDLLAAAADGYVSPEAEAVARRILAIDPDSIPGRYYMGAMFDQTDRPDMALQLWRSILESGAAETFHLALARRFVGEAALRAGRDYTPPPATQVALEDVLGNDDITETEQAEMIQGMVASLADRLATQGGPVNQWARLIVAYGVLGQETDAKEILAEARDVFGASEEATAILDEAAARAGLE